MTVENTNYNGWKNEETWNVMLHIRNNGLDDTFKEELEYAIKNNDIENSINNILDYTSFIDFFGLSKEKTSDGVSYLNCELDYLRLDEAILEMRGA